MDSLLAFGEGRGGGVIMRRSDLDHQLFALVGRGVVVWQVRGEVRTDFDHLYAFGGEGGGGLFSGQYMER